MYNKHVVFLSDKGRRLKSYHEVFAWKQVQMEVVWSFCLSENTSRSKRRFPVANEFQHSGSARINSRLPMPSTIHHVNVEIGAD